MPGSETEEETGGVIWNVLGGFEGPLGGDKKRIVTRWRGEKKALTLAAASGVTAAVHHGGIKATLCNHRAANGAITRVSSTDTHIYQ